MTGLISVSAQDMITGIIVQASDSLPITGSIVMVKDASGKILAYDVSDSVGRFSIKIPSTSSNLSLNASMMGYKPFSAPLTLDGKPVTIRLGEGSIQLRKVVVNPDRIRENGDTVTYIVSSFAQIQDKTIGDVLKHMPGIDVMQDGKIQYQGVDINKFYIEGNDLLGGKYGLATNGILHSDIGAVEILENHQPMQVLRGLSFSDQAAINLKMKNKSKATLLAHGTMAGGFSGQPKETLWQEDIFTMMVTGKHQMINAFKGNNTGLDLSDQLTDYTTDVSDEPLNGYLSLTTPITPNLNENRGLFNRSWMVSSNHLFKTTKGREFKAQIDYSNNRVLTQSASLTTYFLESGDKVIFEDKNSLSHRNTISGKFVYEANEKSYFLNNTLSTNLAWNDLALNITGALSNTQTAKMPESSVCNLFKVIKRHSNNRLVTFTSRNEWRSLSERLVIKPEGENYGQKIKQYSFYTDENVSLGFVLNKALLSLDAGLSGYIRHLNAELFGVDISNLIGSEALCTDFLRGYATPKFEWSYKKLELTMSIPVNLNSYFFTGTEDNRTELFLSPSLAVRFRFTPRMSLTLRGSVGSFPASLHDIHSSSILSDYRTFNSGVDDYYISSAQSLAAVCNYRNASSGIFLVTMGRYGWSKTRFGIVQNVIDDYVFYSYNAQPSDSRNAMVYLNASKTLNFMRGAIGLRGNYKRIEQNLLSQGLPTDYSNDSFSLSPYINGNILAVINWNLRFAWEKSMSKISEQPNRSSNNFVYSGSVAFAPCSLITWKTGGEFYRNQIEDGHYKNMFMLDTKLTLNLNTRIELSVSATNLLNNKEYSYTSYGTVLQYERSSALRGREFMISLHFKK
jgi:hypothetical protein